MLAISPNISADRIGLVLLDVFVLLIPSANYLAANPERRISSKNDANYSISDFISLAMVIGAFYLGWLISWQFNFMQGLYLFTVIITSKKDSYIVVEIKWFMAKAIQGLLLYVIIYLGLNGYEFSNLLRIHILLFASLSILIITSSLYISNQRENYLLTEADRDNHKTGEERPINAILILIGLQVLAYGVFFITTYHWRYAGYFLLSLVPAISVTISLMWKIQNNRSRNLPNALYWLNTVLALCLMIFFIYFFLDSTQILQAILGGY